MRLDLDFETQITSFAIERKIRKTDYFHLPEIPTQGGFQFRNPNPDFMDFLLYRFIGKFEKDLRNYSREQWSFLCKLCVCVPVHSVLENRFSNPYAGFPIKGKETGKSGKIFHV